MIKSLGKYISGYLVTFIAFTVALVIINTLFLGGSFYNIITQNYGATSPQNMLDQIEPLSSSNRIEESGIDKLQQNNIWAMFLDSNGNVAWSVDLPDKIPMHYTLQDVAVFSKGYITDFPVFIRNIDSGILVLGYPSDSYTKLTSNYYSMKAINRLPYTISILLVIDFILLFIIYYFSKRKIVKNTEPLITALETLSTGKTVFLSSVHGELSQIADSINKTSNILSKQNIARANWICGVSHDIRTPLSMIMGYAAKLENSDSLDSTTRKTATIIKK